MNSILFISGPCGCGKTTLANAFTKHFAECGRKSVYVIHGDDFHQGFVEPEEKSGLFAGGQPTDMVLWEDILRFNWDCILFTLDRALKQNVDVVVDYVIEDELPRVQEVAHKNGAELYYIVLTAKAGEIERRIRSRGDVEMIERALFLKDKLDAMPENQGHLYDNTDKTPDEAVSEIDLNQYSV